MTNKQPNINCFEKYSTEHEKQNSISLIYKCMRSTWHLFEYQSKWTKTVMCNAPYRIYVQPPNMQKCKSKRNWTPTKIQTGKSKIKWQNLKMKHIKQNWKQMSYCWLGTCIFWYRKRFPNVKHIHVDTNK